MTMQKSAIQKRIEAQLAAPSHTREDSNVNDKKQVPPSLAQFALELLAEAGEQNATNRAEELITQLEAEIIKRDVRIDDLEAHCVRLGQGDAERYWEGRWRDADAQLMDLVAHIERQDDAREKIVTALEALNVAVSVYDVELADKARNGLRALLAQHEGVKPCC